MQLKWMGKHRELVEKFILLFNTYARQYSGEHQLEGTDVVTSSAQIQTLEYIIEANGTANMTSIAEKIGVTRGTFSNNVKKLLEKGYLEKYQEQGNNKNIYVKATEKGQKAYDEYAKFIYNAWFNEMFDLVDTMPEEQVETMKKILDGFTKAFNGNGTQNL